MLVHFTSPVLVIPHQLTQLINVIDRGHADIVITPRLSKTRFFGWTKRGTEQIRAVSNVSQEECIRGVKGYLA
jgi:hypothetical protein